jgi:hypothetical protein
MGQNADREQSDSTDQKYSNSVSMKVQGSQVVGWGSMDIIWCVYYVFRRDKRGERKKLEDRDKGSEIEEFATESGQLHP